MEAKKNSTFMTLQLISHNALNILLRNLEFRIFKFLFIKTILTTSKLDNFLYIKWVNRPSGQGPPCDDRPGTIRIRRPLTYNIISNFIGIHTRKVVLNTFILHPPITVISKYLLDVITLFCYQLIYLYIIDLHVKDYVWIR